MTVHSPVVLHAFSLLRQELYTRIDEAEYFALKPVNWAEKEADVARELIQELVDTIRAVLLQHCQDDESQCPCGEAWPCQTMSTIHERVTAKGTTLSVLKVDDPWR